MKFPSKTAAIVVGLLVVGLLAYWPMRTYWQNRSRINYRQSAVTRGTIVAIVTSTGTVRAVKAVSVGAVVSGPIETLEVDFNDVVTKGQLLATIDPRPYNANVDRDKAQLATRKAELKRARTLLKQAANDLERIRKLKEKEPGLVTDSEMDQYLFNHQALDAQVTVAEAAVDSADANVKNSEANLDYTKIRSPVDGTIVVRRVDKGQTLAAQFQVPELFIVAPDMRQEIHILADVDEADIGSVTEAERRKLPVTFTVDGYPNDLFEGKIFQIRNDPAKTQNVVTYPVMVSASNPDLKLRPGMTASLSFEVDEAADTLRIPNAALRFYPQRDQVRSEDRHLLDGDDQLGAEPGAVAIKRSATEKAESRRNRNRRHVWVADGRYLRAIEVTTGISDTRFSQLVSGDLAEGDKLVTGIQPAE